MTIFELNFLFFYINCVNYASYRTDFMNESPDISRTKKPPARERLHKEVASPLGFVVSRND